MLLAIRNGVDVSQLISQIITRQAAESADGLPDTFAIPCVVYLVQVLNKIRELATELFTESVYWQGQTGIMSKGAGGLATIPDLPAGCRLNPSMEAITQCTGRTKW